MDDAYETEILDKRISVLDILELYPSCELSFSQYLRMLPSLRIRQYSISSSPLWNSECVTLTFDITQCSSIKWTWTILWCCIELSCKFKRR